jgi:hypothetical protein
MWMQMLSISERTQRAGCSGSVRGGTCVAATAAERCAEAEAAGCSYKLHVLSRNASYELSRIPWDCQNSRNSFNSIEFFGRGCAWL